MIGQKIGIIGTGIMGYSISTIAVQYGFKVVLKSRTEDALNRSIKNIQSKLLKHMPDMSAEEKNSLIKNIYPTIKLDDISDVDIVIECIPEDEDIKKQLFSQLDNICPKNTIFATNTSSLSINTISSVISNPKRFIGMHFFNPVSKMSLVEISYGDNTSQETIDSATDFAKRLNKKPVIIKDTPGFIVNRLLFHMLNEACYMLENDIASVQEIDMSMKLGTNLPMGPFELMDFIGIDIVYNIIKEMSVSIPNFKPSTSVIEEMIKQGMLGRKTKEGFYKY